jgi:hypothetical protein
MKGIIDTNARQLISDLSMPYFTCTYPPYFEPAHIKPTPMSINPREVRKSRLKDGKA